MAWFHPLLRPELSQIRAYQPAHAPADAVRLDANESPFPWSAEARRHLADALASVDVNRYPDVRATRIRERVAERTGADPSQIVIGCGSDEVISLILGALSAPRGDRVRASILYPEPTFVMFRIGSLATGAEPVGVVLDEQWDLDVPAMRRAIEAHEPNVIFLPSPNNPTGNLFADDRIDAVIDLARERSLVMLDEAYGAFANRTYRARREQHAHVGQLQTLSKIGVAGARVGWAILPRGLAEEVDKVRGPYNLNSLSQRAAELVLGELAGEFDRAVARIVTERERLARELSALPKLKVWPSAANFLWVDVGDAHAFYDAMFAKNIVVRSFHTGGGRLARHVRITVGTPEENARLLEAVRGTTG
jgi:histidinol-phosphate aminotransferase